MHRVGPQAKHPGVAPAVAPASKRAAKATPKAPARAAARKQMVSRFGMLALVLAASTVVSPLLAQTTPGHVFVVASGSMGHTIPKGSLVFAGHADPAHLDVGNVIVYDSVTGVREVHRVVATATLASGATAYHTRGDANPADDSYLVQDGDVVGKVRAHLPYVGYLWLLPPVWQAVLFGGMVLAYVAITLWDARRALHKLHGASLVLGVLLVLLVPGFDAAVLGSMPTSAHTASLATPPLPFSSGTWGTTTTANSGNTASVSLTAPKLWKEEQLWGCTPGSAIPLTCTFAPSLVYALSCAVTTPTNLAVVDTSLLDGTVDWYLEAVITAQSGQSTFVRLFDSTAGSAVTGSELSSSATTATRVRTSSFALSNAHTYCFQTKVGSGGSTTATVSSVKLLSAQQYPTKTATPVMLSGGGTTTSTTAAAPPGAARWLYEGSSLDGTITPTLEVILSATLGTTTVTLFDTTSSTTVATVTSTSAVAERKTASPSLTSGDEYEIRVATSVAITTTGTIYSAHLILAQSSFTKTLRYEDLAIAASTTSTSFGTVGAGGAYNMATEWGSTTGIFEATLLDSTAGQTATAQLFDTTANAAISSSSVSVTGTTVGRQRATVTLPTTDPGTYAAQLKTSANTGQLRSAWLIVAQANGKTYDHALKASNNVAGSCTWSFKAALTGNTGISKLTSAKIQLTGDSTTVDQVIVANGVATQSSGSAVTTAFGNTVKVVAQSRPNASGTIELDANLQGTCGGVHVLQPFALVLQ